MGRAILSYNLCLKYSIFHLNVIGFIIISITLLEGKYFVLLLKTIPISENKSLTQNDIFCLVKYLIII